VQTRTVSVLITCYAVDRRSRTRRTSLPRLDGVDSASSAGRVNCYYETNGRTDGQTDTDQRRPIFPPRARPVVLLRPVKTTPCQNGPQEPPARAQFSGLTALSLQTNTALVHAQQVVTVFSGPTYIAQYIRT